MGERGLLRVLARYMAPAGDQLVVAAPDDDAAVWRVGRELYVGTVDTLVEDVDFRLRWPGFAFRPLGRRLMAVNLSDLAAMGAQPRYGLISLCLPPGLAVRAVVHLYQGIAQQAQRYGFMVAGGDLSATKGPIVATAALFGAMPRGRRPMTRHGGAAGWQIAVTGTLGGAAAGLALLESGRRPSTPSERRWVRAQLDPTPRLQAASALQKAGVRVAGDISDGLHREVEKIAEPAGLGAELQLDTLPVDPALQRERGAAAWRLAIAESEDFELVCAAPARRLKAAAAAVRATTGLRLTVVGELTREPGVRLLRNGRALALKNAGYEHFR